MKKSKSRLVRVLVAVIVASAVVGTVYSIVERRAIAREVEQSRTTALSSTSAATSPDDARRWLAANGYRVIVWNPYEPRGFVGHQTAPDGQYAVVQGQRPLRRANRLTNTKPAWLDVTFRYLTAGAFHDVQADPSALEAPTARAVR